MGAWGYRTFEDDTACDWLGAFRDRPHVGRIEAALDAALGTEFVDDLAGPNALAAAEVVAALHGRPADGLDGRVAAWAAAQPRAGPGVLSKARAAVARVLRDSELRDVWLDAGSLGEWEAAVGELRARLADGGP